MANHKLLFIDVETFSSVDIGGCGLYKYQESIDFDILICGYAFDHEEPVVVSLATGEKLPREFTDALTDKSVKKVAHNSAFERGAFNRIGYHTEPDDWMDTMIMAAYCGLPLKLDDVCKVLNIKDAKLSTGKALIRYFSCPCNPTKINGGRCVNLPQHAPEKWDMYCTYNKFDVLSEREIYYKLEKYATFTDFERALWSFDQGVNDRGIMVDKSLAEGAIDISERIGENLYNESKRLSGLDNPNSPVQLKQWYATMFDELRENLSDSDKAKLTGTNLEIFNSGALDADAVSLILSLDAVNQFPQLKKVLQNRQSLGKSSTKKYATMLNMACDDGRARGTFQFYGANRTGRWAGRGIQLQNMTKNHFKTDALMDRARDLVRAKDLDAIITEYGNPVSVLSQLVRTALIPPEGHKYCVADFGAIEARVISWISGEEWRMEVFRGNGKIYEATASRMFGIPIDAVTPDSDYRKKGKVSELALGYAGGLGAMVNMGGERMGLTEREMLESIRAWRLANPKICALWKQYGDAAIQSIKYHKKVAANKVIFDTDDNFMTIELPSGRKLYYFKPCVKDGPKGYRIMYYGMNQVTKAWCLIDTHGGKLVENVVQAISRDLIGFAMLSSEEAGFPVVMHVHDEEITEIPDDGHDDDYLTTMILLMTQVPSWAEGLPLRAAGFTSYYYMKD